MERKKSEMEINIEVDYKAVEEAVRRAGMMIKEAHLSADSVQHKEGAANFVTSYDVAIQRFLIDELHRIVPEAAFFGEEGLREAVMRESEGEKSFEGFVERLLSALDDFTGHNLEDDVAMLALRFDGLAEKGAHAAPPTETGATRR